MNLEITNYTLSVYDLNLEYFLNDYTYTVKCDFEWSDECTSHYTDFTIKPISGTFFHSDTDEVGIIEITDEYTQWLQDQLKEYRNNTLWLYEETLEKMRDLETEDFTHWAHYGI
jgi:hypothetical protein